jgi:hypothetical protein
MVRADRLLTRAALLAATPCVSENSTIQRAGSLRVRPVKTLKFPNKNALLSMFSLFVARCVLYTQ